jgi:hypothetical protein
VVTLASYALRGLNAVHLAGLPWRIETSWIGSVPGRAIVTTAKVDFSSVRWGSVEWTNLVTLYLRAYESHSRRPILGDQAAAEAVDRIDYDFKRIHRSSVPASNQYLVALRAKQLDGWCADFLARHPQPLRDRRPRPTDLQR